MAQAVLFSRPPDDDGRAGGVITIMGDKVVAIEPVGTRCLIRTLAGGDPILVDAAASQAAIALGITVDVDMRTRAPRPAA